MIFSCNFLALFIWLQKDLGEGVLRFGLVGKGAAGYSEPIPIFRVILAENLPISKDLSSKINLIFLENHGTLSMFDAAFATHV